MLILYVSAFLGRHKNHVIDSNVHRRENNLVTSVRDRGYNFFSFSTQLSTKFILLINVKMPTIVGILTFMSTINTSEHLKARTVFFEHFGFYEHLKSHAQLS